MVLRNNPVLQRELLLNLRQPRAFLLLLGYVGLLSLLVIAAWPEARKIDMTNSQEARTLVNLFFLGQYLIASLMTPSFAAGAITGEKERKSYEMLLASPLRPGAIVLGKLLSSLGHIVLLIVASLPIVMLCLPLGGVSFYELLALYWALLLSVVTYGMISLACSSYFQRTAASLVVSYLLILPTALVAVWFWQLFEGGGATFRLFMVVTVVPAVAATVVLYLMRLTIERLLHPEDVGSEGKEVVDEKAELTSAVGMVIQRDAFPDRLFAPPKRDDLLADGANPVFDKEMRSELFSQGTLMLRIVIQMSMILALPLMAVCLYFWRQYVPWYISYVILFNVLVGPVFTAGSISSERERETLELLLVTILSPWQILWGKLLATWRISAVLTGFLLWPLVLACVMDTFYWFNWRTLLGYLALLIVVSLTTSTIALYASVLFNKTTHAMLAAYLVIAALFMAPPAVVMFAETFVPAQELRDAIELCRFVSPFSGVLALPLSGDVLELRRTGDWNTYAACIGFYLLLDVSVLLATAARFRRRWRVA